VHVLATEPKLVVPEREWRLEVARVEDKVRVREKLYVEWGRYASRWRWYRRPEDLERVRAIMREIWANIRDERAERATLAKKVVAPYWRIGIAYMFRERVPKPPYYFYAEFRITVYTRNPDRWAKWDPKEMMYKDPQPELEAELRELLFIASILAGRRHYEWLRAVVEIPGPTGRIPDFEAVPIDKSEVKAPLDVKQYYVRIEEPRKAVEYDNKNRYDVEAGRRVATVPGLGVESWFREYRRLVSEAYRRGKILSPSRFMQVGKQRSLDEWRAYKEEGE
jgi:hypothetical protein